MNTPTTPTPDLESLRKAVQEFRPNPHRVPFNGLKPVHDSIVELRRQNVSYAAIAELLQQHGVKTSRARVAEYGRIVLEGGKIAQTAETGENRASRKYPGHASKCARRGRKTRAGHAAGNGDHKRCPAATKRKFAIPFTRTAHRQRENDGSRGSQRIQ